jgi:putative Mg2+ transporter-C (MgtC) family protein
VTTDIILRVLCALLLGAIIGLERQVRQRHAGLRTNTLVSVGSALFVTASVMSEAEVSPTRVAAQIVSGIGFLGAGVIMREGSGIRGLNTAATLWCSAAVGTLCGMNHYAVAGLGTVCIVLTNMAFRPLSWRLNQIKLNENSEVETCYLINVICREQDEAHLRSMLVQEVSRSNLRLRSLTSSDIPPPGRLNVEAELVLAGRDDGLIEGIIARLCLETGVTTVKWWVSE